MFATIKRFAAPPPPGAGAPPLWGDEEYVRGLFGDAVASLTTRRQTALMSHCANPLEFREYWKRNYGPVIAAYRFNQDRPERLAELDDEFLAFLKRWNRTVEPGKTLYPAEYLVVTAVKR